MFDSLSEFEQHLNEKEATRAPNRWADRQKGKKKPQEPAAVPLQALRKLAEPTAASLTTTAHLKTRRGRGGSSGNGVMSVGNTSDGGGAAADGTLDVIRRPGVGMLAQFTSSGANALNRPDRPPPKVRILDELEKSNL